MKEQVSRPYSKIVALLLFAGFSAWWVFLQMTPAPTDTMLEWFSGAYGLMALFGALLGIRIAKLWGGFKSLIGRAIMMFSLGLLAQEFGQISYSFYTLVFHHEIPYPSIGDVGYFGSVLLYIYGVVLLGRAVTLKFSFKSYFNRLQALIVPLVILAASYVMFLREYEWDWSSPVAVLLDFGYPLGQAVYVSLAILVFILSRKYLGGIMRSVILFLLFALCIQYVADFMFLYQTNKETWTTAGLNDYTYLLSYFVMTFALLGFKKVIEKISTKADTESEG